MSKKVWISLPLITSADGTDASVVGFTKGGLKKELEIETAAFITKWLMDKSVPFSIDFESSNLDRDLVLESLPKRLQKALGYTVSAAGEVAGAGVEVEKVEADTAPDVVADGDQKPEPAGESPFGDAGDEVAEPDNGAAEDTPGEN